jgi:hypothetical protein
MSQQLLHPPEVKAGPHEVNGKAVPERMGVDVYADHTTIFLDTVPDLHAREGKNGLKPGCCGSKCTRRACLTSPGQASPFAACSPLPLQC